MRLGRSHTGEGAGLLDPRAGKLGRVEFADQRSQVEMLHDASEGKTFGQVEAAWTEGS